MSYSTLGFDLDPSSRWVSFSTRCCSPFGLCDGHAGTTSVDGRTKRTHETHETNTWHICKTAEGAKKCKNKPKQRKCPQESLVVQSGLNLRCGCWEMHWLSWQPKYAAIHSHVKRIILAWKQIGHNRTRSRRHGGDKVERALATFALQWAWPILFRSVSLWPQRSSHQLSNETCHCKWMQMDWHNMAQHGTTWHNMAQHGTTIESANGVSDW